MKLNDFMELDQQEQVNFLYINGVYLGKQKKGNKTFLLYQAGGFYVELRYRRYRYAIEQIRCFESTTHLDPYLKAIDIEELINH